jgi:parallel beta-helix repeat protein
MAATACRKSGFLGGFIAVLATVSLSAGPVVLGIGVSASGATIPSAPTLPSARAGNGQATVNWTAPADDGGSAGTGYVVTPYLGGVAQATRKFNSAATTEIVTGLANGKWYTFVVAASNAVGTGPHSIATSPIFVGLPTAPHNVIASAALGQAVVSWTKPSSDGGSSITGYAITPYVGGVAQAARVFRSPATVEVVTRLTNGSKYSFKVQAITAVGAGLMSAADSPIVVGSPTVPSAPTGATAVPGDGQMTLSWKAPVSNGSANITAYLVTPYLRGVAQSARLVGASQTHVIGGLVNADAYTFRVSAHSAAGLSPQSAASVAVIVGSPVAPTAAKVVSSQIKVSFTPGASNGSAITIYTVRCASLNGGITEAVTGASSPITVIGLSVGKTYTCQVAGKNARGVGPFSARSVAATLVAAPASIQSAINAASAGTTFALSGNFALTTAIAPKGGDSFIGPATLNGGGKATLAIDGNNVNNVSVRGLLIEHFNNASQIAALGRNNEGSGWVIENNEVAFNATEGIFVGVRSEVRNNHVHHNGQLGMNGYRSNYAEIAGNEIDHNGAPQYVQFEGGGLKLFKGTGITVWNNNVHDNDGSGIWLDTDVVNSTVTGNTVTNNSDATNSSYGIEIEITCNVTVSNNTITGTSSETNAVMVSSSHNVSVTHNTTSGTQDGIMLWLDTSRSTQAVCGAPSINNDKVTFNTETLASGSSHTSGVYVYRGSTAPTGVSFAGNTYHAPDCSIRHWQWFVTGNINQSFAGWLANPQDPGASCGP